ncbi:MAG: dihydrofolate reductase [Bacteroidetes bacterium GWC2_33_15]|nr:MAG: dihydrofolate reductase [Bacteroidetes bacterium GWA2_33_15]OFX52725.1 MAG: dihydrofolate reductase [Bacteroidetes bacterium GWC2_33_15]OFX64057.1 MAG: dihydrofolate reductase [Bacteroidetes bacterium GWB2_32_14]OFX67345.1 MAG: dihydrofolate reductase [Bacteroidetes bacterium GWD2_33_33]HAN18828.1 dihydrofolate reductase [Bacteroidales bacterium]
MITLLLSSCTEKPAVTETEFKFQVDRFEEFQILRYQIPDFESLDIRQKKLLYYLGEAAKCGRDITFDQNFKYNLMVRKTLDAIVSTYTGDRTTGEFEKFMNYTKKVWFANGIHHHYSTDKFIPGFSSEYFSQLVLNSDSSKLPLNTNQTVEQLLTLVTPILFDPNLYAKKVASEKGTDIISASASNFYEGVTMDEVNTYYEKQIDSNDSTPVSYGLNTKVVKDYGIVKEISWKADGMYGQAISKIIYWLDKAKTVAENEIQAKEFELLIEYYKTGNLEIWDEYNVLWAGNTDVKIDYVNGFIEVYDDPLAMKATWESVVNVKNEKATELTQIIGQQAQWFEDNSPVDKKFKKEKVKGVSAKVIDVAQLGGGCYPASPLGINLPNADWIRKDHGSKSVTLKNIGYAYDQVGKSGYLEEFIENEEVRERVKKYSDVTGMLHTDLHEVVGHGSGQLLPGTDPGALKSYQTPLEESRADLFGLYYLPDAKLIELGLLPDTEAYKAQYDSYTLNGLMSQLARIQLGKNIEQAHMRGRQMISKWVYEKGKNENVIEMYQKDGKTYIRINDYEKLRVLFGELLAEIQRIKSEGDYKAGEAMVENYGVKIDQQLHKELLERYAKLNRAVFGGFMNPDLVPVIENDEIIDVKVEYPDDYTKQMIYYGEKYSYLPVNN